MNRRSKWRLILFGFFIGLSQGFAETVVTGTITSPVKVVSAGVLDFQINLDPVPVGGVSGTSYQVILCTSCFPSTQVVHPELIQQNQRVQISLASSEISTLLLGFGYIVYPISLGPDPIVRISGFPYVTDPSIRGDPDGTTLWLSYGTSNSAYGSTALLAPRLAISYDRGISWVDLGEQTYTALPAQLPAPYYYGAWEAESSVLVYDQDASWDKKWKLFSFRYLRSGDTIFVPESWIALKSAYSPILLPWEQEHKLFTGAAYSQSEIDSFGPPEIALNRIQDSSGNFPLADCLTFGEPGAVSKPGALYLSLGCSGGPQDSTIHLLRLNHSSESWTYVGKVLSKTDLPGNYGWTGSDMFSFGGNDYILASPVQPNVDFLHTYGPCRAFQFSSISSGKLVRDSAGALVPFAVLPDSLAGGCTFDPLATQTGILSGAAINGVSFFNIVKSFIFPSVRK